MKVYWKSNKIYIQAYIIFLIIEFSIRGKEPKNSKELFERALQRVTTKSHSKSNTIHNKKKPTIKHKLILLA